MTKPCYSGGWRLSGRILRCLITVDQLRWEGPKAEFPALGARSDAAVTEKKTKAPV